MVILHIFTPKIKKNHGLKKLLYFRVPADKHPQIAPIEFANFIKTHGTKLPTKSGRLHRRRSILSQSLSVKSTNDTVEDDDEADLNRTLSEKKRNFLKKVMADKGTH